MKNNIKKIQITNDELKESAEEKVKDPRRRKTYGTRFLTKQDMAKRVRNQYTSARSTTTDYPVLCRS